MNFVMFMLMWEMQERENITSAFVYQAFAVHILYFANG